MTMKVGGADYQLVFVEKVDDKDDSAELDSKNSRIIIKTGMFPPWFFRTLLHEYIHDQRDWSEEKVEEIETLVSVFLFENDLVNWRAVKKLRGGG